VQPLREVVLLKAHFGEGKLFGVEGRASASLACVHVCVFVIMCVCAHVYTHERVYCLHARKDAHVPGLVYTCTLITRMCCLCVYRCTHTANTRDGIMWFYKYTYMGFIIYIYRVVCIHMLGPAILNII